MLRRIVIKNILCPVQIVHCTEVPFNCLFLYEKVFKKTTNKKNSKRATGKSIFAKETKQHKHKTRENSYIECAQKKDLSFLFHNKVNNKTGGYSKAILCFSHKVNTGNKIKVFK